MKADLRHTLDSAVFKVKRQEGVTRETEVARVGWGRRRDGARSTELVGKEA